MIRLLQRLLWLLKVGSNLPRRRKHAARELTYLYDVYNGGGITIILLSTFTDDDLANQRNKDVWKQGKLQTFANLGNQGN